MGIQRWRQRLKNVSGSWDSKIHGVQLFHKLLSVMCHGTQHERGSLSRLSLSVVDCQVLCFKLLVQDLALWQRFFSF